MYFLKLILFSEIENKVIPAPDSEQLLKSIQEKYNHQMSPYYAASRMWIDEIIDPLNTRKYISKGIEIANNNPKKDFKTGVIQT